MEWVVHRTAGGVHPMECSSCRERVAAAIVLQRCYRLIRDIPSNVVGVHHICNTMVKSGLDPDDVEPYRRQKVAELKANLAGARS